ncbi:helix-turn-helix domain-containing protein [Octadecabacter sp. G9-8]|uniref:Helix-turn-helix domain-containing protein n=1 Tax=Octadecabacter dasysiphoniae TaxID=2909341 RepID=A0ABS9CZQ9_9RHOB|nr:helix-turn-helix domain-containing protein [Octadecabacter dasysiphoniae]MCF2872738.1 helix-turn-helix domain-containing protein [Octadecabacter dasysiphoniae]
MIRRGFRRAKEEQVVETAGFDAFELRLGDLMRGERATMGKSLLDVQRELKIKAAYIAAIENADPTAFDTPGFIAGYVRSYARYLNMDPDWAFDTFCTESGFATAHGMSEQASGAKPLKPVPAPFEKDIFATPNTPFIPAGDAMFSGVEPRAVGSFAVLIALIGGLGYGGYTVLQEVQKVQLAPVENTPTVVADIDPLAGGGLPVQDVGVDVVAGFEAPSTEALDRLYRPQALDAPVLVPRDGPIANLDPRNGGALGPTAGERPGLVGDDTTIAGVAPSIQVTENPLPGVQLVAVRDAWVRVRAADGTVLYETVMTAGDTFDVPQTEEPATLRIGESGAVYFAVNGAHYGPVGPSGQVTSNLALTVDNLTTEYAVADLTADSDLAEVVRVAEVQGLTPAPSDQ